MLDEEEAYLGDALGALYIAQYFSPRTKQRYEKLTDEIFAAFGDRIRNLTWMSQPTKDRALMHRREGERPQNEQVDRAAERLVGRFAHKDLRFRQKKVAAASLEVKRRRSAAWLARDGWLT